MFEKNNITMSLMVEDKQLLQNYKKISKKPYKNSITANIYDETGFKEVPEEKVPHKCLSIIILDSVLYAYEKYHPQIFLEECKYVKENIKTKNYIDMELESESDSDSDSDNGIYIDIDNEE